MFSNVTKILTFDREFRNYFPNLTLHGAVTQQRASPLLVPVSAPQHGTRPRRCSRYPLRPPRPLSAAAASGAASCACAQGPGEGRRCHSGPRREPLRGPGEGSGKPAPGAAAPRGGRGGWGPEPGGSSSSERGFAPAIRCPGL